MDSLVRLGEDTPYTYINEKKIVSKYQHRKGKYNHFIHQKKIMDDQDIPKQKFKDFLTLYESKRRGNIQDKPLTEFEEKIINRESLFKLFLWSIASLLFSILIFLIIYNIIIGNLVLSFTDLRFSDLLSLCLAIFAIFLSIAFYFKATETSNIFYNNSYEFTNHVLEILGRMEAGFEEKLRQIDVRQTDIMGKVEKIPEWLSDSIKSNAYTAKKELSSDDRLLQTVIEERDTILQELMNKTTLQEHEKNLITAQLKEKDQSIDNLKKQISQLSRQLENASYIGDQTELLSQDTVLYREMKNYLFDKLLAHLPKGANKTLSFEKFVNIFEEHQKNLHPGFIADLKRYGFITKNGDITSTGLNFLNQIYHSKLRKEVP